MNEATDGGDSGITVEVVAVVDDEVALVAVVVIDVWLVVVAVWVMVLVDVTEVILNVRSPTYDIVLNGGDAPHLLLSSCFVSQTLV